jgi:hypothetical protein
MPELRGVRQARERRLGVGTISDATVTIQSTTAAPVSSLARTANGFPTATSVRCLHRCSFPGPLLKSLLCAFHVFVLFHAFCKRTRRAFSVLSFAARSLMDDLDATKHTLFLKKLFTCLVPPAANDSVAYAPTFSAVSLRIGSLS